MANTATRKATNEGYCPHCFLLVEQDVATDWPQAAMRCPHCRLLIGPGRGRPTADATPGARGSAAGVFAHQAKRDDGDDVSEDEVRKAIRRVADDLGSRPERLLMVDYQQRATADDTLPTLSDVFSAFGSWKRARREAAV
ncbi:MAG: hypothetical protein QOH13_1712 [Thermoleophilaceae bacterium]|jgi:hypothetical protein|nr:hypothetical protein [Thermoleophilaceae bacterium]